ncbi:phosphoribosylanthranilate isomerase [Radiobacillus sp. PE A8.2]|uniref:phosphoribosylanthranilate isomerase n=1 Tax=Radiobacillus sp. PE A8.2 TaxID=3380349 RepID=UPI00388F8D60
MKVKICGITTIDAAKHAANAGADFIGFVFADSKRRIDVQQAKKVAAHIPADVKKVGVFVNETVDTIHHIATTVGLDYVQLHGDESPAFCEQLDFPIIKAFQVRSKDDLDVLENYACEYYLLDSPAGKYRGGNGDKFDWTLAKHMPNLKGKILLAGGLHEQNVQQALAEVNPDGVDVSSGVETNGQKDLDKITAFITKAKSIKDGD